MTLVLPLGSAHRSLQPRFHFFCSFSNLHLCAFERLTSTEHFLLRKRKFSPLLAGFSVSATLFHVASFGATVSRLLMEICFMCSTVAAVSRKHYFSDHVTISPFVLFFFPSHLDNKHCIETTPRLVCYGVAVQSSTRGRAALSNKTSLFITFFSLLILDKSDK